MVRRTTLLELEVYFVRTHEKKIKTISPTLFVFSISSGSHNNDIESVIMKTKHDDIVKIKKKQEEKLRKKITNSYERCALSSYDKTQFNDALQYLLNWNFIEQNWLNYIDIDRIIYRFGIKTVTQ